MSPNQYMQKAIEEAFKGMRDGQGGPFGAVIVQNGKIIATAHNQVVKSHDPTAHAEIMAIRQASQLLGRFDLSDCQIYSSCEPCPMCLAAIHWAKIGKLYFGATRYDARDIGFDDNFIYEVIQGTAKCQKVEIEQMERDNCLVPFAEWQTKNNKTAY